VSIAETGEFGLIARIIARLDAGAATLLGPGDDGAVVAAPDGRVVASTDVLVEGRHFRRDWSSAADVGHRAAAANLADIAAMGAVPTALLIGLCAPADLDPAWAEELADGLTAEAGLVGAAVVGGDMSASPTLTIAVTVLGDLRGEARSPAAPVTPPPATRSCPADSVRRRCSWRRTGGRRCPTTRARWPPAPAPPR
jgi:thiamine-monophosphate kinase